MLSHSGKIRIIVLLSVLVMNGSSYGMSESVGLTGCMDTSITCQAVQSDITTSLGTTTYNPYDGYNLFSPEYSKMTYLMDNQENVIHMWESNYIQGLGIALLEDGHLLRSCSRLDNFRFVAGGFTGRIEKYDWNNTLVWSFDYSNNSVCLHHDLTVLPNGNILLSAWEYKSEDEVLQAGRDPNQWHSELWPDHIIEVKPIGSSDVEIVWEWHVWDHLIQDYDVSKDNYGEVKQHPELIDVNYFTNDSDWNHINSIDYNAKLDQILLSSRNFCEIWVIDHSTTTAEAAGHTGGRYGKGGDLLYRWGNPQTYRRGTAADQIFFAQHHARWIPAGYRGAGNILVFNNGLWRDNGQFSSVDEFTPPLNQTGDYLINNGFAYGPEERTWSYTKDHLFSSSLSSAQRLPNGNTLICEGNSGYFFEVTMNKTVVWEYLNRYSLPLTMVFQVVRYPLNYSGVLSNNQYIPYPPTTPNGPTNGQTANTYSFSTRAIDPNDDQLYYVFDWGDTTKSTLGPFSSGYSVSASHHWKTPGIYEIRIRAINIHAFESEWSEPLLVNINWNRAFLIGKLDEKHIHDETITFYAKSLLLLDMHPFEWTRYSDGVYMEVSNKYVGILTSRIILGRFELCSIN